MKRCSWNSSIYDEEFKAKLSYRAALDGDDKDSVWARTVLIHVSGPVITMI